MDPYSILTIILSAIFFVISLLGLILLNLRRTKYPLNSRPIILVNISIIFQIFHVLGLLLAILNVPPCYVVLPWVDVAAMVYGISVCETAVYVYVKRRLNIGVKDVELNGIDQKLKKLSKPFFMILYLIIFGVLALAVWAGADYPDLTNSSPNFNNCGNTIVGVVVPTLFILICCVSIIVILIILFRKQKYDLADPLKFMRDLKVIAINWTILVIISLSISFFLSTLSFDILILAHILALCLTHIWTLIRTFVELDDAGSSLLSTSRRNSFAEVMSDPKRRTEFEDYARSVWCIEAVFLFEEIQEFQANPSTEHFMKIYRNYIAEDAIYEANLGSATVAPLKALAQQLENKTISEVPADVFNTAKEEVQLTLVSDPFRRFKVVQKGGHNSL